MAKTIATLLLELGFRESFIPCDRPNKPYHFKLGESFNYQTGNRQDILFSVEVHNEKLQNAYVTHGHSGPFGVPLYAINTIEKVEHFLSAVKA